jgi:hypothetical protein
VDQQRVPECVKFRHTGQSFDIVTLRTPLEQVGGQRVYPEM